MLFNKCLGLVKRPLCNGFDIFGTYINFLFKRVVEPLYCTPLSILGSRLSLSTKAIRDGVSEYISYLVKHKYLSWDYFSNLLYVKLSCSFVSVTPNK